MAELSSLSFALREMAKANSAPISNGHAQQLLAAALGHNTLASLQASGDLGHLDAAHLLLFDWDLLQSRASDLEVERSPAILDCVWDALAENFPGEMYGHLDSMLESFQDLVESKTWNDEDVCSQMAMTNGTGPGEVYMPLESENADLSDEGPLTVDIAGHVTLDQDPDKVFWGTRIDVEATLTIDRVGRRLFRSAEFDVTRASLRWFDEDPEELASDHETAT